MARPQQTGSYVIATGQAIIGQPIRKDASKKHKLNILNSHIVPEHFLPETMWLRRSV